MTLDRRALFGLAMLASSSVQQANAGALDLPRVIRLWPNDLPEAIPAGLREVFIERSKSPQIEDRALSGISVPRLEAVWPARPNGASILIMPGGGYRYLAWDKEGPEIARWFASQGVTAFSLAYRLPGDGWSKGPDTPLADAQRAVRLVRASASNWGLDPLRIAVLGFSAGGHLATNLGAHFARTCHEANDPFDKISARPDLVAAVYPAILIDRLAARFPADQGLFGKPIDHAQSDLHTPSLNVADNAPPHILVHAEDDSLVGPEHSLALREALARRKVPVETHLYAKGGHGFAIRGTQGLSASNWPKRVLAYGRTTGWITS